MAGRTKEEIQKSRAYMLYVVAYIKANPVVLTKLNIDSTEDLCKENTHTHLPITTDKSGKDGRVSAKALANAFKFQVGPLHATLEAIYEQFEIELSFNQFKEKLKKNESDFVAYYQSVTINQGELNATVDPEEKTLKEVEKENTDNIEHQGKKPKSRFRVKAAISHLLKQANAKRVVLVTLIISSVILVLYSDIYKSWLNPPTIASSEHKKKQYEAVINLYTSLQNEKYYIKCLFKDSTYTLHCINTNNVCICAGSDFFTFGSLPKGVFQLMDDDKDHSSDGYPDCEHGYIFNKSDISYDSIRLQDSSMRYNSRVFMTDDSFSCMTNDSVPIYFDDFSPLIQLMTNEAENFYLPIEIRNECLFFDSIEYSTQSLGFSTKDQDYIFLLQNQSLWLRKKEMNKYKKTDPVTIAKYKSNVMSLNMFFWRIDRMKWVIENWLRANDIEA